MDIRKLEIFVAVIQEDSFSAAAKKLHMAQPAVSIAIRKLEESLNVCLIERDGRDMRLTAEGERAFELAIDLLSRAHGLSESMSNMKGLRQGKLTIACPSMLGAYYLPSLLSDFLERYPGLSAEVTQAGTRRIEEMLLTGEIEIGVVTADRLDSSLRLKHFIAEEMVVCLSKDHPMASLKRMKVEQLKDLPMALYEPEYHIRSKLDELCQNAGIDLNVRLQTNFLPLIVRSVKKQLGATVGIKVIAEQEDGLVGIPLEPKVQFNLGIAWRQNRRLSNANQAFIDWLVESGLE